MAQAAEIRAAGTVLWRLAPNQGVELAVVHRPHYDDWSLPKGKASPGETDAACAVRETQEETGFRAVLRRPLHQVGYRVGADDKVVHYFSALAASGAFHVNNEVDDLRWVRPDTARALLTYPHDRAVLDAFTALPADMVTVLLVRHAKAGDRQRWADDDELRPLSSAGRQQAAALRELLPLFGADRVHAAPLVRCVQTVEGLAADLGVPIVEEPALTEDAVAANPKAGVRRLMKLARAGGVPVVCSQGGAIPDVIGRLADTAGLALPQIPCKKGSVWVLSFPQEHTIRLLAADYLPTALPLPATVR